MDGSPIRLPGARPDRESNPERRRHFLDTFYNTTDPPRQVMCARSTGHSLFETQRGWIGLECESGRVMLGLGCALKVNANLVGVWMGLEYAGMGGHVVG